MLKLFLFVCFSVSVLVASIPLDKSEIEGHIIGGNDTNISQVPYQVAMYSSNRFQCGGFIVSATHVVTAFHCVSSTASKYISFRAGSTSNQEGGVVVNVKKVHRHPNYNSDNLDYDVAVAELATPLPLNNKTIKPIKLATKEPPANSLILISGWGGINEQMDLPTTLQSVTFPVVDRTKCEAEYKTEYIDVTPRMICAGAKGKTPYHGDSGGPAAYKGEVVGIISKGAKWGKRELPSVYTNIANPEINKYIREVAKL